MKWIFPFLAFSSVLALLAPSASAQTDEDLLVGQVEYRVSCASCHGLDGKGKGPVALFLTTKPADLTLLAVGNGGIFPHQTIHEILDGRAGNGVHGDTAMPVWGARYLKEFEMFGGDQDDSALVEARITRLVNYMETIQE